LKVLVLVLASCNVSCSNFMLTQNDQAPAISVMPFQNGVVFQTLIVAASLVVAKSNFNPSDL